MNVETRFSSALEHVSHLPEPLASTVQWNLADDETISLLIYKPAEIAGSESSPPKVLAVTDRGFLFVEQSEGRAARVVHRDFDSVLLVEMATLLLYGHLRIDYIAMEYNAIAHDVYCRAATLILDNASATQSVHEDHGNRKPLDLSSWPTPIHRAAELGMLSHAPVYTAAWWPSVRAGFGQELAPAGTILARTHWLTVVTLEQSGPWDRVRSAPTFGLIATYLPADRIAKVEPHHSPRLTVFELELHVGNGGEHFRLAVPEDREASVRSVIDDVLAVSHQR
jgi:hypothetical protein